MPRETPHANAIQGIPADFKDRTYKPSPKNVSAAKRASGKNTAVEMIWLGSSASSRARSIAGLARRPGRAKVVRAGDSYSYASTSQHGCRHPSVGPIDRFAPILTQRA